MDVQGMYGTARPPMLGLFITVPGAIALCIVVRWLIRVEESRIRQMLHKRGTTLAMRPHVRIDHYLQACIDSSNAIRDAVGIAGHHAPEAHRHARRKAV